MRGYRRGESPRDPKQWVHLARLLMQPPEGLQVDHINGDTLDNRRMNLRICTPAENRRNSVRGDGKFKGVAQCTRYTWMAYITKDGARFHLGTFTAPEKAAAAYNGAAIVLHGRFANLNVIPLGRLRCLCAVAASR